MPPDPRNRNGSTYRCTTCPRDACLHESAEEIEQRQHDRQWAFSLLGPADQALVVRREADRQFYGQHGLRLLPAPSTKDIPT